MLFMFGILRSNSDPGFRVAGPSFPPTIVFVPSTHQYFFAAGRFPFLPYVQIVTVVPTGPAGDEKSHFFFLPAAPGLFAALNGPKLTGTSSPPPRRGITTASNSPCNPT